MKVYTRTGDAGQTSLFNGARVAKNDARVEAYGTVDECNASVGLAVSHLRKGGDAEDAGVLQLRERLTAVQHRLFDLGAHLATPRDASSPAKLAKTAFAAGAAAELEAWIDEMEAGLAPLTTFILPGGHPAAAALHMARTIARRAERAVTPMLRKRPAENDEDDEEDGEDGEKEEEAPGADVIDPAAYTFLNRLSDFFFVASRYANKLMDEEDVMWKK